MQEVDEGAKDTCHVKVIGCKEVPQMLLPFDWLLCNWLPR